jgi:hypothetical protein
LLWYSTDFSLQLFGVNNRLSPRPLFRPICNVRKRTGETARRSPSTAKAEWRLGF